MVEGRPARVLQSLFALAWLGLVALAVRAGATAFDVNPEHLLGMLPLCYMAAWAPYFLISPGAPIAKAARFIICTGSILAVLAAFEIPGQLGFVDYRSVFSTPIPPWRRPENSPDSELIYVRKAHQYRHFRFSGDEVGRLRGVENGRIYECDLRVDRNGFRNSTDSSSADVVVLGDSFVEGLHVADSELISVRLADRLGQTVVNLGRTGYGPQQELHVLRRYGVPLRPKTCIWAFYEGNDLNDSAHYRTLREIVAQALRERPSRSYYGRTLTRNALSFAIRSYLTPLESYPARQFSGRFVERSGQSVEMLFYADFADGKNSVTTSHGDAPEMPQVRSVLADAHALCASQGIDLIVLFVPAKLRIYADLCTFDETSRCRAWNVDNLPSTVLKALASISPKIGFLDLTPRFRAEAASGELLYLPDDGHWTAEGHDRGAAGLAELLRTRHRPDHAAQPVGAGCLDQESIEPDLGPG